MRKKKNKKQKKKNKKKKQKKHVFKRKQTAHPLTLVRSFAIQWWILHYTMI